MHSLLKRAAVGAAVVRGVWGAPVAEITAAPSVDVLAERQDPDAVSLAQILLTAIPESLRQIAATDLPAVSSILWEEFLDDNRPDWFLELPREIQNYLIKKFGPQSAWPTEAPASSQDDGMWRPSVSATTTSDTSSVRTSTPTSKATSVSSASSKSSTLESSASKSTASHSTASHSSEDSSHIISSSLNLAAPSSTPSSTPTSTPDAPAASTTGLSKTQKISLGLGIPFGLLAACAFFFACCTICRRRRKKHVEGSIPPASPGFIPRFAFQEKHENTEYRTPLNRASNTSANDFGTAWDDEGIDPHEHAHVQNPYAWNDRGAYNTASGAAPFAVAGAAAAAYTALDNESDSTQNNQHNNAPAMAMHDPKPIMAPALYHTHSSNRARGRRTSYTSLASLDAVTEVTEPDDMDSPVLGRHASFYQNQSLGPGRKPVPTPTPTTPAMAQIKRKPVPPSPPMSPSRVAASPAAHAASQKLLRQTMPEHSGSSSSGLALSTSSGVSSTSALGVKEEPVSPISPVSLSNRAASNPFQYDSYVEDYGPEYHNGYVDVDDSWYGGHTSLSQYPETRKKPSRTEWPLRNLMGSNHRRKSSPLWERVYEE